jgi:hypothetical protein
MPSLSADSHKLVYGSTRGGRGIFWFRDLKSGRDLKLTSPDGGLLPRVCPDAIARDRIVFARGEQTSSIWLAEAQ